MKTLSHTSFSKGGDNTMKQKHIPARCFFYLFGMLVLAMGLILNIKAGLGSSAIMSVAYTISEGAGVNLGDMTFVIYCLFIAAQMIINGKDRSWPDLLQLPLSLVFTRFMNLFKAVIPYEHGYLPTDLLVLLAGIVLTGIGAAMTVDMQLIPNSGDGIVNSIARRCGRELGFTKNIFDCGCVAVSLLVGAFFGDPLLGIGLGTVISMLGVGRVVAAFNHLCKPAITRAAGLEKVVRK